MVFVFVSDLLSMKISRSLCAVASGIISFIFMAEQYSIVYIYHIFFIHLSVDGHLGCFHVLAFVNSAVMNTGVHVSLNYSFVWVYAQEWDFAGSYESVFILTCVCVDMAVY